MSAAAPATVSVSWGPGPAREGGVESATALALAADIDRAVGDALREGKIPGAVVAVGSRDRVLFHRAYGWRSVQPSVVPMTEDTLFDLASLTKPVATATSLMVLADRGQLTLDDPLTRHVPECAARGKGAITLRQLMTHVSGLPAETPYDDYRHGREEMIRRLCALPLRNPIGARFVYSDVGFLLLEEVVRRVSGGELDAFAEKNVFAPLQMTDTTFRVSADQRLRTAPTEVRDGDWILGAVHDPRAHFMGGVAGHAGLFSTALDVSHFAQFVLGEGARGGTTVLSPPAMSSFIAPHDVPGAVRSPGWDMHSGYSGNRGEGLSFRAIGHGGYTGTVLWIDPELDLFVVVLSHRVHPDGHGSVQQLAAKIGTAAAHAQRAGSEPPAPACLPGPIARAPTRVGIDVLEDTDFAALRGAKVGLVTNAGAVDSRGQSSFDIFRDRRDPALVAVFSPEHGFDARSEGRIEDDVAPRSGVPIHSLYGDKAAPTDAQLEGIDTLVIDLQDVGVRYFTYASTMHEVVRAAALHGLKVVILDRPDPLNGVEVAGPIAQPAYRSFVNHEPLPWQHGMTMGELARFIDAEEHLGTALRVVPVQGWRREDAFEATGLSWTAPSPNLRTENQAQLYPAVAPLEGTNISVGRGTETPFEWFGAPWMDGERVARALTALSLPGVTFTPVHFTPTADPFARKRCEGVRLTIKDRPRYHPVRTALAIARELRGLYPNDWQWERMARIVAHAGVLSAIGQRQTVDKIEALTEGDLREFRAKREKYLLYPTCPTGLDAAGTAVRRGGGGRPKAGR